MTTESTPSEDWLDISKPTAGLPVVVAIPNDIVERAAFVETCWQRLSERQRIFLAAYRDCRFNERATARALGLSENTKPMTAWMKEADFAGVVKGWKAGAAADALNPERLLIRQDAIVEQLLEPQPVLHQGVPTGFYENRAPAAARANEALLDRAVPKDQVEKTRVVVNVVRLTGEFDPNE